MNENEVLDYLEQKMEIKRERVARVCVVKRSDSGRLLTVNPRF